MYDYCNFSKNTITFYPFLIVKLGDMYFFYGGCALAFSENRRLVLASNFFVNFVVILPQKSSLKKLADRLPSVAFQLGEIREKYSRN